MAETKPIFRCDGCTNSFEKVYACRFKKCEQTSLCKTCIDGHRKNDH